MIQLKNYRNIHCIGIGGIGLSGIAEILLSRGYKVTGSDMKASEITQKLERLGAKVFIGHQASNVDEAELIIYSAAIADENPEIVRARERNIPLASRAQVLGEIMDEYGEGIAISGTHGKTTTTSMVALILGAAKMDPTVLVGGNLPEIGGNARIGGREYFVTEACEYRDSFLELRPDVEVILNIDSDHLDYFRDIDHIVQSFRRFAQAVPETGWIIAYESNPFIGEALSGRKNVISFGYNQSCTYQIVNVRFREDGMPAFNVVFHAPSVERGPVDLGRVELQVPGEHNVLNAAAAFACCHLLGVDPAVICRELGRFSGTGRRFDMVGITDKGVRVVDDYAHHPTEIKATLSASRNLPHDRLWCIFQPHTYTRTLALFDEFAGAFEMTDILILTDIYAAREEDIYNISSEKLAEKIKAEHPDKTVLYMSDFQEIADYVIREAGPNDLVLTMGAGDVFKIGKMILAKEG